MAKKKSGEKQEPAEEKFLRGAEKASRAKKVRVCAECGTEFVPTKGYRHCCSAECQKARIQAGSAKGAKVTKDMWAVEKMRMVVGDPDVKDALGV